MASRCKRFEPNIFNKSKCQSCFKAKEQHSAEALECSKSARKISRCGYLFVAPETFDFGNPLDRSRRWQRRFGVLYDDGELTWSVDENINTVPQGSVDMNKCTDVPEAESLTGHQFSFAVKTPERTVYMKGSAKDETARWRDVLIMYPRSTKTKHRRTTTVPASVIKPPEPPPVNNAPKQTGAPEVSSVTSTNNISRRVDQRRHTSYIARDWQEEDLVKSRESSRESGPDQRDRSRSPGQQRSESVTRRPLPTHLSQIDKERSPSPRHRSRSVSGPRDNAEKPPEGRHVQSNSDMKERPKPKLGDVSEKHNPSTYRSIRSMKHKDRAYQEGLRKSSSLTDLTSERHTDLEENLCRSRSRDNLTEFPQTRDKKTHSYSSADSGFHSESIGAMPGRSLGDSSSLYDGRASFLYNRKNKNETDEHKMAKSEELAARINKKLQAESPNQSSSRDHYDDLMYMKKGWLLKLDESSQEWQKNWFVLSGVTLRYYKDGKAEEANQPEGAIDISACYEAGEIEVSRNYGFNLKTNYGDYVLSAMTSGIRNNWVSAILKCMETVKDERTLSDIEPLSSSLPSTPSRTSSRSNSIGPDTKNNLSNGLTVETSWGRPPSALSDSSRGSITSPGPEMQSHTKFSDSGSADSSPTDARRRLNMDGSRSERSPSPQKRFSCTWPYTSSSSEAGSTTETEQATTRARSNSTGYSQDDIESHGERKARKVSRRANSEYVYRSDAKPVATSVPRKVSTNTEQIDVKRSVSVPSEAPSIPVQLKDIGDGVYVSYLRNRTGSPRTRRRNAPETDRTKIPAPARAPSAKIKDKSKIKSPRPRSPPPSFKPEPPPNVEPPVNAGREDIIERKWKEVEQHGRMAGETGTGAEAAEAMGGECVVVDLLETEVESLRGQLENARVEVDNLQRQNTELRLQMRSATRDHRESVEDLEDDRHRYISQTQQQLHEAKSLLTEKEKEVSEVKGSLSQTKNNLKAVEVELEQSKKQLEKEQHNHSTQESHWKERCQSLQREVDKLNTEVQHKQKCIASLETHMKQLQDELEKKVEEVEAISKELEELVDVRDRAADTASRLAESQALADLLEEKLRNREDQHRAYQQQVTEMETEFQQEKSNLEQQLEQMEQRLERAHNHTNLQDGLNRDITELLREKDDTIAQLEEKLIENDAKIQELTEDLRAEIQESQTLQQNLDQAYDDQALLKRDLDVAKKESQKLESQLIALRQEVQELRSKHDQQATIKLRDQLKEMTSSVNSLEMERERMRTIIDQYKVQVETSKEDLESERGARKDAQRRMEELQKQNREVAMKCANLAKELAAVKDKSKQLEDQLLQHGTLESDLKHRHKELLEAKQCAIELQEKLAATQKESQQTEELLDQSLGAVTSPSSTQDTPLSTLQRNHEQMMKEMQRLRGELKKAHNTIDDLEIAAATYDIQFRAMQDDYKQQLNLMTSRVQDLTSKLTAAEKRVRKLERKVLRSKKKEKELQEGGSSSRKGSEDSIVLDELETELGASDMNSSGSSTDSGTLQVDEVTSSALEAEGGISAAGDMGRYRQGDLQLRAKKANLQLPLSAALSSQKNSQSSQLLEVELKLRNTLNLLQECRGKLSGVVQDLETSGALPTGGRASIHVIKERLVEIMKDFDEKVNKDIDLLSEEELAAKQRLKYFAEKLSLEAVVVGEMACLLKSSQDEFVSSRESQLSDIEHANTKIQELENKVQCLQSQGQQQRQIMATARQSSMQLFSAILAEKVILQSRLQLLLERLREEHSDIKVIPDVESVSSLPSKLLAQGELSFVLNKLKEKMTDDLSDQERADIVAQELDIAQHRLVDHAKNMTKVVASYEMDQLEQFATALAQSEVSSFSNINRDNFISDLTNTVRQKADESAVELSELKGEDDGRWEKAMQRCLQQEIENVQLNLQQLFEEKLEDAVEEGLQGRQDVPVQAIHSALSPEMVDRLAEIIGQKAAVSGLVAYVTDKLKSQPRDSSNDGPESNKTGSTHNLRRHDSGVILHGSSMSLPTSPVNEGEVDFGSQDIDLRMVSHRLALDADTRQELASFLQEFVNKECVPSEQTRLQIGQIASDLVHIDSALVKHKKSIHEYAEVVTKEAIMQAQMTCIINKLQMEHEHQVKLLQSQLEAAHKSAVPKEHVSALEQEVERLSKIISENDSVLNSDAEVSSEQVQQLRRQVEEMEAMHIEERKDIEAHYKKQIDYLSDELQDSLAQFDEQKGQINKYKNQLLSFSDKAESDDDKSAQLQIDDLEDELDQAHKDLATLVKLRDENEGSLRRQVADLEKQQSLLVSTHKKELEQAKADMQTAMRAVSASEMNKYEQELLKLKEKLDDERRRHLDELEKLRKDLCLDSGSAAEALLSSKILQLEQQMQNMQADYEQELAIQKAAHRRELARSKDDMLQLLTNAEVHSVQMDKDNIRKRYLKEMDKIKEIYDRSFAAIEKSHQKVLMEMRQTHKRELDLLRQEKDQLLAEETHATQAALDAMKKAHEAEVQKERNKFLDLIAKTYSPSDVDALQKQHQEYAEMMQKEMEQLSEQYSLKCLENASLEEQVSVTTSKLSECRRRITDLMTRNEELEITLKHDVERLNKYVKLDGPPEPGMTPLRKLGEPEEVYDLRVALKVKDVELGQLKNEISTLRHHLSATTQELEDKLEENEVLQGEQDKTKMEFQRDMFALRSKLEQMEAQKAERERRAREGRGHREESPEPSRSPSPKRSKVLEEDSDAFAESLSGATKISKRSTWRQRNPERSRSTPTISADTLARIAQVAAVSGKTEPNNNNTQETENVHGKARRKTTVGINLSAVQSQEHF